MHDFSASHPCLTHTYAQMASQDNITWSRSEGPTQLTPAPGQKEKKTTNVTPSHLFHYKWLCDDSVSLWPDSIMVNGIYIAPLSKALYNWCFSFTHSPIHMHSHALTRTHTHSHALTPIGCHARYQPARQEQLGVRCLAQGHFNRPRVGSNRQPSDRQMTALTSWAISPHNMVRSNQIG